MTAQKAHVLGNDLVALRMHLNEKLKRQQKSSYWALSVREQGIILSFKKGHQKKHKDHTDFKFTQIKVVSKLWKYYK